MPVETYTHIPSRAAQLKKSEDAKREALASGVLTRGAAKAFTLTKPYPQPEPGNVYVAARDVALPNKTVIIRNGAIVNSQLLDSVGKKYNISEIPAKEITREEAERNLLRPSRYRSR